MLWLLKQLLFLRTINISGMERVGNDLHLSKKSPVKLFFLVSNPDSSHSIIRNLIILINCFQVWEEGDESYHQELMVPALLIYGAQDKFVTLEEEQWMQEVSELIIIINNNKTNNHLHWPGARRCMSFFRYISCEIEQGNCCIIQRIVLSFSKKISEHNIACLLGNIQDSM